MSARTTADVSAAVRVLASQDCAFAVRSGGHATNANYSASPSGVTIDLSGLASVKPSTDRTTVSVGPGARWGDVYTALRPYDLTVAGGRASSVGVGGLTAGGGVSFFSPRVGFTADTLVGAEVVLASGAVVQARDDGDGSSYADLLRALRGGGNNFGLVTRFDFAAIEAGDFWGGLVLYPDTVAPLQLAALADFSSQPDYDEYATAIVSFSLVDGSVTLVSDTLVYTQNITTTPPVFHPFLDLPGPISSSLRSDSHRGFADEGDLGRSPGQRYEGPPPPPPPLSYHLPLNPVHD